MTTIKKSVLSLACLMAATAAFAVTGHIYDIRPYYDGGIQTGPHASVESPMVGGDTACFTLRFASESAHRTDDTYKWKLAFLAGSTTDRELAMLINPLRVGIFVSGELREAKLVDVAPSASGKDYTDFIFEYTVKPGDFALPIVLAMQDGTPATSKSVEDVSYYVNPRSLLDWQITNGHGDTANFWFGSWAMPPAGADTPQADYDLRGAGFYAKTIDFDDNWETPKTASDPGLWRSVHEGSTETVGVQPALALVAAATNSVTLHVWSDNSAAVVVKGEGAYDVEMKLDKDGTTVVTNRVLDIKVQAGQTSIPFDILGVASNKTANLVLSAGTNYTYNASTYARYIDYITVPVACVERLPANVTVALDGDDPLTVNVTSNYEDAVGTLTVKASTGWTNSLTVTVTPRLKGDAENAWSNYIHIADGDAPGKWATLDPVTLTFTAEELQTALTAQKTIYLFAMGADSRTTPITGGIQFDVAIDDTSKAYYEKVTSDSIVYFKPTAPVIVAPAEGEELTANGGVTREFEITVSDSYKNMADRATGYTICYNKGDTTSSKFTELTEKWGADENGVLYKIGADGSLLTTLPAWTYSASGDFTTSIKVTAPDGKTVSAVRKFKVTVTPPATAEAVTDLNKNTTNEGVTASVYVKLSQKNRSGSILYAFLEPLNEDSSNMLESACLTCASDSVGLPIWPDEDVSDVGDIEFLDGSVKGTSLRYKVVLCKEEQYKASEIAQGFDGKSITLKAYNVVPKLNSVTMDGVTSVSEDGETMGDVVSKGVEKTFTFDVDEPAIEKDLKAEGADSFQLRYTVKEAGGAHTNAVLYGNANTNSFKWTFRSVGLATVTVELMDKDMKNRDGKFGGKFTFHVSVTDLPRVSLSADWGDFDFTEGWVGDRYTRMYVNLSDNPSSEPLEFAVVVTPKFTDAGNPGTLTLDCGTQQTTNRNVYIVSFSAGQTKAAFNIAEADGTRLTSLHGYELKAFCATHTTNPDGLPWDQFFVPESPVVLTLSNTRPTIDCSLGEENSATNGLPAAIGYYDHPISYTVSDVDFDLGTEGSTTNLTVMWRSDGVNLTTNVCSATNTYYFTPKFTTAGDAKVVSVTVQDKDGGSVTKQWYFNVQTSKSLIAYPVGPSGDASEPTKRYRELAGLGQGHIWVDGATFSGMELYRHRWNCGLSGNVYAYAWGYKVGSIDKGYLNGTTRYEHDIPVSPSGLNVTDGKSPLTEDDLDSDYFQYSDTLRDSFLYLWVKTTYSQGTGTAAIDRFSPEAWDGTATCAPGVYQPSLPTEKDQEGNYADTIVEAVFSKEYLPSDNMGDINFDGVPDLYVSKYKFGVIDATTGAVTGDDTASLATYNEDQDFLPGGSSAIYSYFVSEPNVAVSVAGTPFTAPMEIRGAYSPTNTMGAKAVLGVEKIWSGLNDAVTDPTYGVKGVTNETVYADFRANPLSTLTELEYEAWCMLGRDPHWSPERPTDPTVWDTDSDNLSDGYEYYYWYRAHVGYLSGTNHVFLTGRRYNPANPNDPFEISSDEIEKILDPQNAYDHDLDSDGDGLSNFMESALGTNPVDFDTDGDGLPDGYEVIHTGTDPLAAGDAMKNPDGDMMAAVAMKMHRVGFLSEDGTRVEWMCYDCLPGMTNQVYENASESGWVFAVGTGANPPRYVATARPALGTNAYGLAVLAEDLARGSVWAIRTQKVDGADKDFLGEPAFLPRGTILASDPAEQTYEKATSASQPVKWYRCWRYRDGDPVSDEYARWIRAGESDPAGTTGFFAFSNRVVVAEDVLDEYMQALHYNAYQAAGFNPNYGWSGTRAFTHLDEFMTLAFFRQDGCLPAVDVSGRTNVTLKAWADYTTDPKSCDTDQDGTPDGWELFVMVGPQAYDTTTKELVYPSTADKAKSPRASFPVATTPFGPFVNGATTDADGDGLDWVNEFSGIESSAVFADADKHPVANYYPDGVEPTIACQRPDWRNKKRATDPWNEDTDGDGMKDGEEGTYFLYGSSGKAGGGLDPTSWDTDLDGLPDPWEAEFKGTWTGGESTSSSTTSVSEDGTTNTTTTTSTAAVTWNDDGMDGTVDDAMKDYDHDGLVNWQEYMVGAMRHFRYDDPISQWGRQTATLGSIPAQGTPEWDEFWTKVLLDDHSYEAGNANVDFNPNMIGYAIQGAEVFDPASSYFSYCTNKWDAAQGGWYIFRDGIYHDLKTPPPDRYWSDGVKPVGKHDPTAYQYNRFTFMPAMKAAWGLGPTYDCEYEQHAIVYPRKYICCNPAKADTDNDGMDDYYELFHGLNPLLGASGVNSNFEGSDKPCDIVFEAYQDIKKHNPASAENNYFLNGDTPHPFQAVRLQPGSASQSYDFAAYPWLAGLAVADPDGDDIRNQKEAILPNMQAAATYLHTDPSPLWMTDTSYGDSFVRRYYSFEAFTDVENLALVSPVDTKNEPTFVYDNPWTGEKETRRIEDFPGFTWNKSLGVIAFEFDNNRWQVDDYVFSFEENEGYDSDHDYLNDSEETEGRTKSASDPQDQDSPLRRQAMWFNGTDAVLETPAEVGESTATEEGFAEARENLLYFTVECWAKADAAILTGDQTFHTLVERSIYTGESGPADSSYVRKNFQIGVLNGKWYAGYDSSGTKDASSARFEITDGPKATTAWTHIAASYDGSNLRLYVNGVCNNVKAVGREPEHGIAAAGTTGTAEIDGHNVSWNSSAFLVGGSAKSFLGHYFDAIARGLTLDPLPSVANGDYGDFFKGYIDEVRVWDGARSGADILADVENRTRYTAKTALANRDEVYAAWAQGARRATTSATALPPQLLHHWTFDHIPGAVSVADIAIVPTGFGSSLKNVKDAKAYWTRPEGWTCPWWASSPARSTVYTDAAWVPWIGDTVGHLPRFDQTTDDSMYWSANFAGATSASTTSMGTFAFPRSAEVYSRWVQMLYPENGTGSDKAPATTPTRWLLIKDDATLKDAYTFAFRNRNTQGDDLVPLGGAYPKRISTAEGGMWDDATAADAWAQTGVDSNNDGLPDWWTQYALENYNLSKDPTATITWNTTVLYRGIRMAAYQAYKRDLAKGMLSDQTIHPEYKDTCDLDGDGMPDWWEEMYAIDTGSKTDATGDPDHDGLSNYQEYLISEVENDGKGYYLLNPNLAHSVADAGVVDYFLQITNTVHKDKYLGEVYADHDFMEDDSEDIAGLDRTRYDARSDNDEDGWTAFSEMRYSTFKMGISQKFLSHLVGDEEVKDFPTPVIHATLRYNGDKALAAANASIVVSAYSGNNLQKEASAVYTVAPGVTESRTQILGAYTDQTLHGTLTPGNVIAGEDKVSLEILFVQPDDLFAWTINTNNTFKGTYAEMYAAYAQYGDKFALASEELKWANLTANGIISYTDSAANALQVSLDAATQKGHFLLMGKRAGELDFTTGDFTLNLSSLGDIYLAGSKISLAQCFFRLSYSSKMPALQTKALTVSLAAPDTGNLVEGTTAFSAYIDLDGDGYTAEKDPIGFVKGVEIGWDKVPELVIEMTDSSQAAGKRFSFGDDVETLRIIRTAINGEEKINATDVKRRIVYSRTAADVARKNVYEADLVSGNKFGLDWSNLRDDIDAMTGLNLKDVTSVGYTIVNGAGSVLNIDPASVITNFTVTYAAEATVPECVAPSVQSMGIVETARPTFRWTAAEGYTAFRLQIGDAAGANWFWSSDLAVLPPKDTSGAYVWTAPVFIGTNVTGEACILANGTDYTWRVAMYNAKFSKTNDTESAWSAPAAFSTLLAATNDFSTAYGSANVTVRYFGPATNGLETVIVQLYRTADFTGTPDAQTRLFDTNGFVKGLAKAPATVTFCGLSAGDYYAVAFVDRNGNGARDRYETWGYAAQVDLGREAIWTPSALAVDPTSAKVPSATVYMEDTDVNQDDILDWDQEIAIYFGLESSDGTGADTTDVDGDGLAADTETSDTYTDAQKWDTDGDSMPDGWENWNGKTDPLDADADTVADGDVMAYVEVTRILATVTNGAGVAKNYLLDSTNATIRVGDDLAFDQFRSTYDYVTVSGFGTNAVIKTLYGVGTNLVAVAGQTLRVQKTEEVTAVLVHAQVYDAYGYDMNTCVAGKGSVNTKPFQALDKYMLVRYLTAIGVSSSTASPMTETAMNKDKKWADWTLKPGDTDCDRDGMADGWELYMMFGTQGVTNAVSCASPASATISPWKYSDARTASPGGEMDNIDEYNGGDMPTDPWNTKSLLEILRMKDILLPGTPDFTDKDAHRFRMGVDEYDLDADYDQVKNLNEFQAYLLDRMTLDNLSATNAWSDGSTPDYFRSGTNRFYKSVYGDRFYLGQIFNGGEFIESVWRKELDIADQEMAGTRVYGTSGWDNWSVARYAQSDAADFAIVYTNVSDWGFCAYDANVKTEDEEAAFDRAPEALKRLQRLGKIKLVSFECVKETDEKTGAINHYHRFGYRDLTTDGGNAPVPEVKLTLRYAGSDTKTIVVEAYQVNSAYSEMGEQMTARWSADVPFNAGLGSVCLIQSYLTAGKPKQGPARFVAYIDVDGDGKYSAADTFGTASAYIGYLGCEISVALGEQNPSLPILRTDSSNAYTTVALVRTKINGVPLYNDAAGVLRFTLGNNIAREAVFPAEYVSADHCGLDRNLATFVSENFSSLTNVASVTYEVIRSNLNLDGDADEKISTTELNDYAVASNGQWLVYHQDRNEEIEIRYDVKRNVAAVRADAAAVADDITIAFTVPNYGTANTRFWLGILTNGAVKAKVYGGNPGFLLSDIASNGEKSGLVTLDRAWLDDNKVLFAKGETRVWVALGNDLFGKPEDEPSAEAENGVWSGAAKFVVNAAAERSGLLTVNVAHPVTNLTSGVTVALYETEDLANPVAITNNVATGTNVVFRNLRAGASYYAASWYVKDANDGRSDGKIRQPYDTWGYLCAIDAVNKTGVASSNGFTAVAIKATALNLTTNTIWMQDTDWNDNGVADRLEEFLDKDAGYAPAIKTNHSGFKLRGANDINVESAKSDVGVMAYAEVPYTVITGTDGRLYAVVGDAVGTNVTTVGIAVGTPLNSIGGCKLAAVYQYNRGGSGTAVYGLGTNVTVDADVKADKIETKSLVLVHAQVYDAFGFDATTANGYISSVERACSKTFTGNDKAFVTNYLANVLGFTNLVALTELDDETDDSDRDGIMDGWELYAMFGAKGIPATAVTNLTAGVDTRVLMSPWNYADRNQDADGDGLSNLLEYDGGYSPTDPSEKVTAGDGITDYYARTYHLKGQDAGEDFDGDGLSNYAEYLISEVFQYTKLDPDDPKTDGSCIDYFRKMGELYFGEIFTDHDQVDDLWEDGFAEAADDGAAYANRHIYDPSRDADGDGWSNYAEAKAGTNPELKESIGVDGYTYAEHPVPMIEAHVTYNGKRNGILAPLVFKAYNEAFDADMVADPDATWTVAATSSADSSSSGSSTSSTKDRAKYLGQNPCVTRTFTLGPGGVSPGTVRIYFRDQGWQYAAVQNETELASYPGDSAQAKWYALVQDSNGILTTCVTNETTSIRVGTVDYTTGRVTIDFSDPALTRSVYARIVNAAADNANSATDKNYISKYYNCEKLNLASSYVKVEWTSTVVGTTVDGTYYLGDADPVTTEKPGLGYVREGKTKFVVFADTDSSGDYTAGEPFGFVYGVDIGWEGAKLNVTLTDTHPVFARISLTDGSNDRTYWQEMSTSIGTNAYCTDTAPSGNVRVRVVRTAVNGEVVLNRLVMDKWFNTKIRAYLHEGDFLTSAHRDIDWEYLSDDIEDCSACDWTKNVQNVTYSIVFGQEEPFDAAITNQESLFTYTVDRWFDTSKATIQPTLESDVTAYTARPTFRWSITSDGANLNTYTAFKLEVFAEDGTTLLYTSGLQPMPGFESKNGVNWYVWTAPPIVGNLSSPYGQIERKGTYKWRVTAYNSKYQGTLGKVSALGTLTTEVNQTQDFNDHACSAIPVAVKYAGPSNVLARAELTGDLRGKVRVQAFTSGDFTGTPVSEAIVTTDVADTAKAAANGKLYGLPKDGAYYLRAYIDMNGNCQKDDWESWGAAKEIVTPGETTPIGIWIEDADTDDDWLPDAWEFVQNGWSAATGWLAKKGKDLSGEFIVTKKLKDAVTGTTLEAGVSSGMSGATLTVFTYDTVASLVCGSTTYGVSSVDEIRKAVERKVQAGTVKITSISLDPTGKKVVLGVAAETAQTIAGRLISQIYAFDTTATVKIRVYRKDSLVTENWTVVENLDGQGHDYIEKAITDNLVDSIPIDLGTTLDMSSGFYRVEVEQ